MQTQTYEVYVENGRYFPVNTQAKIEGRKKAILTVFDESMTISTADLDNREEKRREAWERIQEFCSTIQPNSDFDEKAELAEAREEKYGHPD